jgi:hypothetical protein
VTSIDGRPVGDGKVGTVTKRLLARFREKAQELTAAAVSRS